MNATMDQGLWLFHVNARLASGEQTPRPADAKALEDKDGIRSFVVEQGGKKTAVVQLDSYKPANLTALEQRVARVSAETDEVRLEVPQCISIPQAVLAAAKAAVGLGKDVTIRSAPVRFSQKPRGETAFVSPLDVLSGDLLGIGHFLGGSGMVQLAPEAQAHLRSAAEERLKQTGRGDT